MFEVGKIYLLHTKKHDFIYDPSYYLIKILEIKKDDIKYVCFVINSDSGEIFPDHNKGLPQKSYREDIIENFIIKQKKQKSFGIKL
jgi:hypothetical protein